MAQTNRAVLVGRLTADAEADATTNGTAVCKIRLAVDRAGEGRGSDVKPGFFNVVSYGKGAEAAAKLLGKGSLVAVDAQVRYHEWEDGDGNKRNRVEFVGEIDFLDIKEPGSTSEEAESES